MRYKMKAGADLDQTYTGIDHIQHTVIKSNTAWSNQARLLSNQHTSTKPNVRWSISIQLNTHDEIKRTLTKPHLVQSHTPRWSIPWWSQHTLIKSHKTPWPLISIKSNTYPFIEDEPIEPAYTDETTKIDLINNEAYLSQKCKTHFD